MKTLKVFHDHDGGVDDYISLLLLLSQTKTMREKRQHTDSTTASTAPIADDVLIDLIGVSVTPADCYGEPAADATLRLLDVTENSHVPVALGTLLGETEFPADWRLDAFKVAMFPVLHQPRHKQTAKLQPITGQQLMLDTLRANDDVTLVMTGPLTNLAWCLAQDPSITKNIKEVVIMGGALDVAGNVQKEFIKATETHEPMTAEWNLFWDSKAAKVVLEDFPELRIRLFSLDVTDSVPITDEFLLSFGKHFHSCLLTQIGGTIYSLIAGHTFRTGLPYYAWDALTVAYLLKPSLFEFQGNCDYLYIYKKKKNLKKMSQNQRDVFECTPKIHLEDVRNRCQ